MLVVGYAQPASDTDESHIFTAGLKLCVNRKTSMVVSYKTEEVLLFQENVSLSYTEMPTERPNFKYNILIQSSVKYLLNQLAACSNVLLIRNHSLT